MQASSGEREGESGAEGGSQRAEFAHSSFNHPCRVLLRSKFAGGTLNWGFELSNPIPDCMRLVLTSPVLPGFARGR
jgi:hypothetical protein